MLTCEGVVLKNRGVKEGLSGLVTLSQYWKKVEEPATEASGGRTLREEDKVGVKALKGCVLGLFKKQHRDQMNQVKKIMRREDPDDLWHETMADSGEAGRPGRRLFSECRERMLVAWTRVIAVEVVRTCMGS